MHPLKSVGMDKAHKADEPPERLKPDVPPWEAARLASPQAYLLDEFSQAGLTIASVATTLLGVMNQLEDQSARISAAELFVKATVGLSPTSQKNLNVNARVQSDKFFDPDVFSNPPPMLGSPGSLPKGKSPAKKAKR